MRKAYRHIGVLFMLSVIALGALGAAYTLWYEDLSLDAEVTTGSFDAEWVASTGDPRYAVVTSPTASPAYADFSNAVPSKTEDITCSQSVADAAAAANGNAGDQNDLTLTMTNVYPFSGCLFNLQFGLEAGSTVPAHFQVTAASKSEYLGVLTNSTEAYCLSIVAALNANPFSGPVVLNSGANPLQLHPGDTPVSCPILVYLKEEGSSGTVLEGATSYSLGLTVKAHQWNETPAP